MQSINLTDEESDLLKRVLKNDISDLSMEFVDIDNFDFTHGLIKKKETLKSVVLKLEC